MVRAGQERHLLFGSLFYNINYSMASISNIRKKRGRGRPPVGATPILVRMPPDELVALDHWISAQEGRRRLAMATPRRCSSPSRRCSIINDEHLRRCSSIFEDAHVFIEDAHESLFEHLRARRGGEGDRARRGEGGEANPKRRGVIVWAARVPSLLRRAPTTEPEGQDDILAMG